MAIENYDLGPGRAKRKADRQAKRATSQANRATKRTARQTNKATKKAAIDAMPGTTKLEKRINYSAAKTAAKDKARRDNRAAVKKAKSVTPEQRKANQTKATSDHNKRLADATAKYGGKKESGGKKKTTYSEAYKKRDMKTYGKLSEAEYTAEAKKQKAHYARYGTWN